MNSTPSPRVSPFWLGLGLLAVISAVGCGKPKAEAPETHDVSVTVTVGGKPLANGILGLQSGEADPADIPLDGSGKLPSGLKFPAGTLRVRVLPKSPAEGAGGETDASPAQTVPEKYHSFESSGLTFEVKPGPNDFTVEL